MVLLSLLLLCVLVFCLLLPLLLLFVDSIIICIIIMVVILIGNMRFGRSWGGGGLDQVAVLALTSPFDQRWPKPLTQGSPTIQVSIGTDVLCVEVPPRYQQEDKAI